MLHRRSVILCRKNVDRSVRMLLLLKPYSVIQNCDDEDDEEKDDESEKDAEDLDVTVAVGARGRQWKSFLHSFMVLK